MKGLFTKAKEAPVRAGAFKFDFKVGGLPNDNGDDSEGDGEPATSATKKKNKKKKKKPATQNVTGDNASSTLQGHDCTVETVGKVFEHITISAAAQVSSTSAILDSTDISNSLSKSQKKNMKRAKAKKAESINPDDGLEPQSTVNGVGTNVSKKIGSTLATGKLGKAPKQEPKGRTSTAAVAAVPGSDAKEDWEIELEEAIKANALLATESKQKQTGSPLKKGAKAAGAAPGGSGPHFLSSKDPELDEAARLRCRYGMGRNLVAIGPAKVRDPNWLPAPPGLGRKSGSQLPGQLSAASVLDSNAAGAVVGPCLSTTTNILSNKKIPVENVPPRARAGPGEGASGVGAGAGMKDGKVDAREEAPSHSSPFSFSFNGL